MKMKIFIFFITVLLSASFFGNVFCSTYGNSAVVSGSLTVIGKTILSNDLTIGTTNYVFPTSSPTTQNQFLSTFSTSSPYNLTWVSAPASNLSTSSSSTGTSIVLSGIAPNLIIAGIKPGSGILVSGPTNGDITISSFISQISLSNSTGSTGISLVYGNSPSYNIPGFKAGSGISLNGPTNGDITVSSTIIQTTITNSTGSTGVSLIYGSSFSYNIPGFKPGSGIFIAGPTNGDITISSSILQISFSNSTGSTGVSLVYGNSPAYNTPGLKPGSGIIITGPTNGDITISSTISQISISNSSGSSGVSFIYGSYPSYNIPGLKSGAGITITNPTNGDITISSTISQISLSNSSGSTGFSLIYGNSPAYNIPGLKSGSGISITGLTNGDLTISSTISQISITNSSGSTGTSILYGSSPLYNIPGFKAGSGISLNGPTNGDITISSTISITNSSGSTGVSILYGTSPLYNIPGFKAGSGISLNGPTNGDITISSTISQISITNSSGSTGISILYGTSPLYNIPGFKAGSGISLNGPTNGDITISSTISQISITNSSGSVGVSLLYGSSPSFNIPGIVSGSGISISQPSNGDITISSTISQITISNATGATGVSLLYGSSPSYQIPSLSAGSGISIAQPVSGNVVISSTILQSTITIPITFHPSGVTPNNLATPFPGWSTYFPSLSTSTPPSACTLYGSGANAKTCVFKNTSGSGTPQCVASGNDLSFPATFTTSTACTPTFTNTLKGNTLQTFSLTCTGNVFSIYLVCSL